MSGNQPPLNFKGKDGTMMGLEVDLAKALASLMNAKLEIVQELRAERKALDVEVGTIRQPLGGHRAGNGVIPDRLQQFLLLLLPLQKLLPHLPIQSLHKTFLFYRQTSLFLLLLLFHLQHI